MNIAFIRGQYINNYELQSYYPILEKHKDISLTGISSLKPKHKVNIPTTKLASPIDMPDFPKKISILNRLILGDAMYLWGLENKLKLFDIAHVRETYFHFSSQAIYAKRLGYIKKVLVTCSETIPFNHETIWGKKRLKQNVINEADYFHCLTEKSKQCLMSEGVNEQKISVIPYGVDLRLFKPRSKSRENGHVRGLFIGRFEEQKGVEELIEAYKILKKEFPSFELRVIGKGPAESKFTDLGLKPEFYPYSNMPQKLTEADFLILPSKKTKYWEEYLGMVLLEAMACGLPVVTTDCGAIPEVIANAGFIVKQGSSAALYRGTRELIINTEMRKRLSEIGLARVHKYFDAQKQSDKLYKLYEKVQAM